MDIRNRPGKVPRPTNVKLLHGETRPSRVNYNEPVPPEDDVIPPEDLSDEALEVWHSLAPSLIHAGVLNSWDAQAYAEYCNAVVALQEAQRHLDEEGEVIDYPVFNRSGEAVSSRPVVNPWWKIRMEAGARMSHGAAHFGLTPADRSRIAVSKPKGREQSNDDLLSG